MKEGENDGKITKPSPMLLRYINKWFRCELDIPFLKFRVIWHYVYSARDCEVF